jgi:HEAT repeat protein
MRKWLSIAILASAVSCSRVDSNIRDLRSSDVNERSHAARALGELGDKRAVDPLIGVLEHDSDLYVRAAAAEALGSLRDSRAIEPLCRALGDVEHPAVPPAAAKALGAFGAAALDPVLAQFRNNEKARYGAAIALGEIGDKRAIAPLLEAKTKDVSESQAIAAALRKLRDPREIISELLVQLEDSDSSNRTHAARALDALGETANNSEVAGALARHLTDTDSSAARAAAAALMSIGKEGRKQLLAALQSRDANLRLIALEPLDFRDSTMLMHPIIDALHDPDPRIRTAAAKCLWGFTDHEAIDALLAALNDPAAELAAAASLENVDDARVVDALMSRLRQRKYGVIVAASRFYVRRGEPGTEPILIDALNVSGGQSMAELLMNSGNETLSEAAKKWARERGFQIRAQLPGGDSAGIRWGKR